MTDQADMDARRRVWPAMNAAYDAAVTNNPALMEQNSNEDLREALTVGLIAAWPVIALTRARELGIMDRVLTDAENAIYDAGMAAAYDRASEVAQSEADDIHQHAHLKTDPWQMGRAEMASTIATAILSLKEGKG